MPTTTLRFSFPSSPRQLAHRACPPGPVISQLDFFAYLNQYSSLLTPLSCCSPECDSRRRFPIVMSSYEYDSTPNVPANQFEVRELNDESDFETILSSDGRFSVCGFGSLLSGTWISYVLRRFRFIFFYYYFFHWRYGMGIREKREEYISGPRQFQTCEIERLSARLRSCDSGFSGAWHCQTRNQGLFIFFLKLGFVCVEIGFHPKRLTLTQASYMILCLHSLTVWFPRKLKQTKKWGTVAMF